MKFNFYCRIIILFSFVFLFKQINSTGVFLEDYHRCRERCEIKNTNNNFLTITIKTEYSYSEEFDQCKEACQTKNNNLLQDICENPSFLHWNEPSVETNAHLDSLKKRCQYFSNRMSRIDLDYIETLYKYKELVEIDCTNMLCYLGGGINTFGVNKYGKPIKPRIRNFPMENIDENDEN
ncbi:hypothetical protein ACTFIZ_006431 [Dictyostelium cf. discoideum]